MRNLITRKTAEQAAVKLTTGPYASLYIMAMLAVCVAAASNIALAIAWLGSALFVEEAGKSLRSRTSRSPAHSIISNITEFTAAGSLAAAPALVWFSGAQHSAILALSMLAALMLRTALFGNQGRMRSAIACAPYAIVAMLLLAGIAAQSPALACAIALIGGFSFAIALQYAHAAAHARQQDAQWLQQLNTGFSDGQAAAWEIDFSRRQLVGADRLSALVGQTLSYNDIIEASFAAPEDKPIVSAAMKPEGVGARRIAIEHGLPNGRRVHHIAFIRSAPDGAPLSLACVSRISSAPAEAENDKGAALEAVLETQAECLKTLSNELSTVLSANTTKETPLQAIRDQQTMILRGIDALAHARHAAESANLSKSQFLANMSHELRTPLNAVIGYAEMLHEDAEDSGDSATAQDLARILAAARHLLTLLNEILDLSKIEAGRMDVSASEFDPCELLDELIDTMAPLASQNDNTLTWVGGRPAGLASTDSMKLRQCLLNFLSNACKFTKNGAIEIHYERRMCGGAEHLSFNVRDSGIGMTSEQVSRLFQPFVQADPAITQQYGGTGLGLTITRRLAQLLGGEVSVESEQGRGSTFTLSVPVNYVDPAQGEHTTIDDIQGADGAPLVIVIEDEPDARELAARALTRAGFAVQGVGGGEAGLALARAKAPALVLLDIFLPDRSGWRVLQSLKHDPKTKDIPVVVLSVSEDRAHALSLGAAEHIVKPADRDKLAATVMRYARLRPVALHEGVTPAAIPLRAAN